MQHGCRSKQIDRALLFTEIRQMPQPQRAGGNRPPLICAGTIPSGTLSRVDSQALENDPLFGNALPQHRLPFQFSLHKDAISLL